MALPKLALYHFSSCPFCLRVRAAISRLGLEVELRDIHKEGKHLAELLEGMGRQTVPVLRIESDDGEVQWMPESGDIVQYLKTLKK